MKRKTKKWIKKHLNLYNLSIIALAIIILVSLIVIFKPSSGNNAGEGTSTSAQKKNQKEISENDARKAAVKKFKELGEKVSKDDLSVLKIQRDGEEYYYIKSEQNTLEIAVRGGKITRVNSVVQE